MSTAGSVASGLLPPPLLLPVAAATDASCKQRLAPFKLKGCVVGTGFNKLKTAG